jgi:putative MATE family efflux protein
LEKKESSHRGTDFTQGSIPHHLIAFAWPMFLGNILQAMYNTVDTFWVGRILGPAALGAVSVGFPIIFALVAVIMGLTTATTVLVSQYRGARRHDDVLRVISNSLSLLGVASLVVMVVGLLFHRPLLRLINTPPELMELASSYMVWFLYGLPFMFVYNALGAILRGVGDSRSPLLFLVYATVLNMILDPLLIFGWGPFPRLGVAGAAIATDVAQAVSAILGLIHLRRVNRLLSLKARDYRIDPHLTWLTVKIGFPAALQQTLVAIGSLAVSAVVNRFGPVVVAAFGTAARFDQFAFLPAMSTSLALSTVVGQNLGAGRKERVSEALRWGLLLTGGITALVSLVALVLSRSLIAIFTTDTAVMAEGARYLRIVGFSYIPFALMFAINGVLRGAGDTASTLWTSLVALWLVRVPLAYFLSSFPSLGPSGVWLAMGTSPFFGLLLSYFIYRSGRWEKKIVVHQAENDESPAALDLLDA